MQTPREQRQRRLAAAEPHQIALAQIGAILRNTSENQKPIFLHAGKFQPIRAAPGSHALRDRQAPLRMKIPADRVCFAPDELRQLLHKFVQFFRHWVVKFMAASESRRRARLMISDAKCCDRA